MLRVETDKPMRLVYALGRHPYLGYIIEPHVVQLTAAGTFSLTTQRVFTHTYKQFLPDLSAQDLEIIKLLDDTDQDNIIKEHYNRPVRSSEFFFNIFNQEAYDKKVRPKLDKILNKALELINRGGLALYMMKADGSALGTRLDFADEAATVLFHFRRNDTETRYFPTLRYKGQRMEFMYQNAEIVCNEPAWLLLHGVLYYFAQGVDGKKLHPFLNKRFISIPKSTEAAYYQKFVVPLIERYNVYAEGFSIQSLGGQPEAVLQLHAEPGGKAVLQLQYKYGDFKFSPGGVKAIKVQCVQHEGAFTFYRIKRNAAAEAGKLQQLADMGLAPGDKLFGYMAVKSFNGQQQDAAGWLDSNYKQLLEAGFTIEQAAGQPPLLLGQSSLKFNISSKGDWFDIEGTVQFGSFTIPFIALKAHLLQRNNRYTLPDGSVAIIPDEWFTQFSALLQFAEKGDGIKIKRHHVGLLPGADEGDMESTSLQRRLQMVQAGLPEGDVPQPENFRAVLRPYQQAGYAWFWFLRQARFGGCLADDMGLGKTVQALALLQAVTQQLAETGEQRSSLLIMPTSLIFNWQAEAKKFAPGLKVYVHTGSQRTKSLMQLQRYHVVLTTYGISRIDAELLQEYMWEYIILDESQNIKNPLSKAYKAVRGLRSRHKLALSGTPVENSVTDLWAQLSFTNPGLLGSLAFFKENFALPIERDNNEERAQRLNALIKPFILRRTKEQVAGELPPKTEQVIYCPMTEEQESAYEEVKSAYRNSLLEAVESGIFNTRQVQLLQGLTRLRQIANHPLLAEEGYEHGSGKFNNVVHTLVNVLEGGHNVLVFSQFVSHLQLFKKYFEGHGIAYEYLDGATRNRQEVINRFQQEHSAQVFLISLKAGGVGLNLTRADYVFMLDPWWNPAAEQQAIDRAHRIGQQKKVMIYKFITPGTVEEKILALQQRKLGLAGALIKTEAGLGKSLSAEDFKAILE